jgi:hypothetical protein
VEQSPEDIGVVKKGKRRLPFLFVRRKLLYAQRMPIRSQIVSRETKSVNKKGITGVGPDTCPKRLYNLASVHRLHEAHYAISHTL